MRAEHSIFAFIERVARALHPYRWWLLATTFGVWGLGGLLMLLGYLGYPALFVALITPRFGAPLLLTLFTWSWSAYLLCIWFTPEPVRASLERASYLQRRIWHTLSFIGRACALVMLAVSVLVPVAMWVGIWKPFR